MKHQIWRRLSTSVNNLTPSLICTTEHLLLVQQRPIGQPIWERFFTQTKNGNLQELWLRSATVVLTSVADICSSFLQCCPQKNHLQSRDRVRVSAANRSHHLHSHQPPCGRSSGGRIQCFYPDSDRQLRKSSQHLVDCPSASPF